MGSFAWNLGILAFRLIWPDCQIQMSFDLSYVLDGEAKAIWAAQLFWENSLRRDKKETHSNTFGLPIMGS